MMMTYGIERTENREE